MRVLCACSDITDSAEIAAFEENSACSAVQSVGGLVLSTSARCVLLLNMESVTS